MLHAGIGTGSPAVDRPSATPSYLVRLAPLTPRREYTISIRHRVKHFRPTHNRKPPPRFHRPPYFHPTQFLSGNHMSPRPEADRLSFYPEITCLLAPRRIDSTDRTTYRWSYPPHVDAVRRHAVEFRRPDGDFQNLSLHFS